MLFILKYYTLHYELIEVLKCLIVLLQEHLALRHAVIGVRVVMVLQRAALIQLERLLKVIIFILHYVALSEVHRCGLSSLLVRQIAFI